MSDLNLLRCMMERKSYQSAFASIPQEMYDLTTRAFLAWFKLYYKHYEDHERVDVDTLSSFIRLKGNQSQEQLKLTDRLLKQLREPLDDAVRATTLNALEERRLSGEAEMLVKRYNDGEEIDIIHEMRKLVQASEVALDVQHASWCDTDVGELIDADADDSGYVLDFLPEELYTCIKGINEGNNVGVAAPTDKGKTSFLVNLAVSFAIQRRNFMKQWTIDLEDPEKWSQRLQEKNRFRPVLYLVNEGTAEVITPRVYQTALKVTRKEMYERRKAGTITSDFIDAVGRRDAIRLKNIHGKSVAQVAKIIEAHDPFLVITDMTGRIRANGGGGGANDITQLEEVWNDMRMLAAMMDFIHVGTAQISAEGFDNLYPPVSALQNSKTGIQTTLDLALWIGAYANPVPDNELMRGLGTPKNKLAKSGCKGGNQVMTFFEPETNNWDAVTNS
ncbi:putative DNA helicase [Acinetobacter phage vB_AbaP_Acibel007]|uniref:Putative DNA helicase n=1 Tax=Acinetobacter phage vB_AbaP_Acibel007 TaxID=1481187 RepID=A0A075DXA9_9CAUD|nr:putative DNA helicase [Acinetobacter phage vB_AbaP_Acibel007]AHY26789.1 putative DNA helicase [Acinetobacter phage vB_AbaP_Acibel007]